MSEVPAPPVLAPQHATDYQRNGPRARLEPLPDRADARNQPQHGRQAEQHSAEVEEGGMPDLAANQIPFSIKELEKMLDTPKGNVAG